MRKIKLFLFSSVIVISIGIIIKIFSFSVKIDSLIKNDEKKFEYIKNDSLRLLSLNFLLKNIKDKYTIGFFLNKKYDINSLDREYLFENIDYAISKSYDRLKKGEYTIDCFLNYVLPYRINHETPEDWRSEAIKMFDKSYNENIIYHAKNINEKLKEMFEYNGLDIPNRAFSRLVKDHNGGCYAMSELAAYSMRANGIPVAIDFAKWSNIRGNHQWNTLITKNNNIHFMGAESDPDKNNSFKIITQGFKKVAKVYRKTFVEDTFKDSLFNPKKVISNVNYIDVTDEYCDNVLNLEIKLPKIYNIRDDELFFLCVYEVDEWIPVDFTHSKGNILKFDKVCPNNLFILMIKSQNKLAYFMQPFTFDAKGKVSFLNHNGKRKSNMKLSFFNSNDREVIKLYSKSFSDLSEFYKEKEEVLSANITGVVKNNVNYELFIWQNKWVKLDVQLAKNYSVTFMKIPENGLYKLEVIGSKDNGNRCFTYKDGNQNWW